MLRPMRPHHLLVLGLILCAGLRDAAAQDAPEPEHVLRIATLAPRGTFAERALRAWNRELGERTGERLSVRVYWGGSMGDERSMIRRMRIGDLEAASLTTLGLGSLVRETQVLQVPGVLTTYDEIARAHTALDDEFRTSFRAAGFELLGWGDSGRIRLFSTTAIARPTDLRSRRPWLREDDPIFGAYLEEVGATGQVVGVGEVLAGLSTGMIDTVPGTALVVAGLQWATSLSHVTNTSRGFLISGMVIRNEFLDSISAEERAAILETAATSQDTITTAVRRVDEQMYDALLEHGMVADDISGYASEWLTTETAVRARISGRVVPTALLDRVIAAVRPGS